MCPTQEMPCPANFLRAGGETGLPSLSRLVAAEAIWNWSSSPASFTMCFITYSAMGPRQILPRHAKRILVILHTLRCLFFFLIADFLRCVEGGGGLQSTLETLQQLRLGPAVPQGCVQVSGPLSTCFAVLQKDHVQGPGQPESLLYEFWLVTIDLCEGPHPPEVPGREALPLWISGLEILCRHHCRTLLWPGTDRLPDGKIEGRLW